MLNINMSLFSTLSNIENVSFSLLTVTEAVWRSAANCNMPLALIFKKFLLDQIKYWYLWLDSRKQETIADTLMQLSLSYPEIVQKIGKHWGWQDMQDCSEILRQEQELKDLVH